MSLLTRLDDRLVTLAAELTADNPMPPPLTLKRFGSPKEQVLEILRNAACAAEYDELSDDEALRCCETAGRVRAAQLASLYGVWHYGVAPR